MYRPCREDYFANPRLSPAVGPVTPRRRTCVSLGIIGPGYSSKYHWTKVVHEEVRRLLAPALPLIRPRVTLSLPGPCPLGAVSAWTYVSAGPDTSWAPQTAWPVCLQARSGLHTRPDNTSVRPALGGPTPEKAYEPLFLGAPQKKTLAQK